MKKLEGKELKNYFTSSNTVTSWWLPEGGMYNFHYDQELKILDEKFCVNPNWHVLDAGCGQGRFSLWFTQRGCRVLAVDISAEMMNITRGRCQKKGINNIDFVIADIEDMPLSDKKFDVISCMEVVDHLDNLKRAIENFISILNDSGYLLLTFTAANSLYGIMRTLFTFFAYAIGGKSVDVSNTYTLKKIKSILASYDIEIENVFGVGLMTFPQERIKIPYLLNRILYMISKYDIRNNPFYSFLPLASHCSSVVVIGRKRMAKS